MQESNHVECVTSDNGITHYSKENPDRCVMEVLFGFVMYIRSGVMGIRQGLTDQLGAWKWLSGCELPEIKHYTIGERHAE